MGSSISWSTGLINNQDSCFESRVNVNGLSVLGYKLIGFPLFPSFFYIYIKKIHKEEIYFYFKKAGNHRRCFFVDDFSEINIKREREIPSRRLTPWKSF